MKLHKQLFLLSFFLVITSLTLSCSESAPKMKKPQIMQINYITHGVVSAAKLQLYIIEYSQEKGFMPKNNAALGFGSPIELARDALKSIEVRNGHIILTYNKKSGVDNGVIVFSPTIDFEFRWLCNTDSFKGIEEFLPQCTYQSEALDLDELTK